MRKLIDTSGIQFRVASTAKPKKDPKDKERQATRWDGRPVWIVRLEAIDTERETKEFIWVEVAGEQPELTFDGYALVRRLEYRPWLGKDGKIHDGWAAEAVEPSGPVKAAHAA